MVKLFDEVRARNLMKKYDVDVVVASSMDNFRYLTDYWDHFGKYLYTGWCGEPMFWTAGIAFDKNVEPFMCLSEADYDVNYINPWIKDRRHFRSSLYGGKDKREFPEVLADVLKEKGLDKGKIGLEIGYEGFTIEAIPSVLLESLKKLLPKAKFVNASPWFREMRTLKTDEEMSRIKKAGKIIDRCIKASFEELKEGMPSEEFEWIIRKNCLEDKIDVILLNINYGEGDILRPNPKKVKKGDFIRIDLALFYQHYYSDVAKCAMLGKPTSEFQKHYDADIKAHDKAVEAMQLGAKFSDVYKAAQASIEASGYKLSQPHVGHGTGICVHEAPYLNKIGGVDETIQPGMTFTCEILFPLSPGSWAGTEDMIVCDKKGCHDITTIGKELIKVG
jgi:Xaa-Pro dipeptidase